MISTQLMVKARRGCRVKLLTASCVLVVAAIAASFYARGPGSADPGTAQAQQKLRVGDHVVAAGVVPPGRYRVGRRWTAGERLGAKLDALPSAVFLETGYKEPDHVITVGIGEPFLVTENISAEIFVSFLNEIEATQADNLLDVLAEGSSIRMSDGRFVVVDESPLVNTVTWDGVERFCEWLGAKLGRRVRPLSEAEWLIGKQLYPNLWPDSILFDPMYDVYSSTVIQQPAGYPLPVGAPMPPGAMAVIPPTVGPYRVLRRSSTRYAARMPGASGGKPEGSWCYGLRVAVEAE
jgi:hypothetical protein